MNKPILCCLKIKQATLFVGIIDLILHMMVLTTLFALYSSPNLFDHYYANSLSLIVSPSSSFYSTSIKNQADLNSNSNNINQFQKASTSSIIPNLSTNLISNSNQLFQLNGKTQPQMGQFKFKQYDSDNLGSQYSNVNMSKDKSIGFLVTSFSSFLTMMLIYGIIKNKPSYLMPYFSIKVFQVVMGCLTTLGFYSCLPNVRLWIETHQFFPMKKELLLLENQTLELFVFSILLTSILVKLYVVIIVWYCYRYMVTIKSFVNMSSLSTTATGGLIGNQSNVGIYSFNDNSVGYKIDDESLIGHPPKYEDIINQIKRESNETDNGVTNINEINNNNPTTSSAVNESSSNIHDVTIQLRNSETENENSNNHDQKNTIASTSNNPPPYDSAIVGKQSNNDQLVV